MALSQLCQQPGQERIARKSAIGELPGPAGWNLPCERRPARKVHATAKTALTRLAPNGINSGQWRAAFRRSDTQVPSARWMGGGPASRCARYPNVGRVRAERRLPAAPAPGTGCPGCRRNAAEFFPPDSRIRPRRDRGRCPGLNKYKQSSAPPAGGARPQHIPRARAAATHRDRQNPAAPDRDGADAKAPHAAGAPVQPEDNAGAEVPHAAAKRTADHAPWRPVRTDSPAARAPAASRAASGAE